MNYENILMNYQLINDENGNMKKREHLNICGLPFIQEVESIRNISGSFGDLEMHWEDKPQETVSKAYLSFPTLSQLQKFIKMF